MWLDWDTLSSGYLANLSSLKGMDCVESLLDFPSAAHVMQFEVFLHKPARSRCSRIGSRDLSFEFRNVDLLPIPC